MSGRVELSRSTLQQPLPAVIAPGRRPALLGVVECIEEDAGRCVCVGIDGRTAAGKTTVGHELAVLLAERGRVVLRASLDDFKRPWAESHRYDRHSGEGYYRNAYDTDAIRELLLLPARSGDGQVTLCSIDPRTQLDHSADRTPVPEDAVLIVDGVFALRPELVDLWDLRIWIDIGADLSIERGIRRDGVDHAAIHRGRYAVAEQIYIAAVGPAAAADLVLDNTHWLSPVLHQRHQERTNIR